MAVVLQPWQLLVSALAGWITRQQDAVIEFLREENRVLKQQLGRKRLRLTASRRKLRDPAPDNARFCTWTIRPYGHASADCAATQAETPTGRSAPSPLVPYDPSAVGLMGTTT